MSDLILPTSFEEVRLTFDSSKADQKLMEFIEPLNEVEVEINEIAAGVTRAGKVVFILGRPGTGKSTFLQSLSWRPHIKIRSLIEINATEVCSDGNIRGLFSEISRCATIARSMVDKGPTCLIINYLENLENFDIGEIKAFFREVNGLLRSAPILVLWPVTSRDDVEQMQEYASAVSTTIFPRNKAVINFPGPSEDKFVDIVKRTISVLNEGKELSSFSLTSNDLEEVFANFMELPREQRNIREYLELVNERWRHASGYQAKIRSDIPKSNEVWFVFAYANAESVVGQFSRKSQRIEDSWSTIHDKLFEYIPKSQRSAKWDAKRLQLALYGAIKTRIMFMPTNSLISCVASFNQAPALRNFLLTLEIPKNWTEKKEAKRSFSNTPLVKQLTSELYPIGKRKGGPAAKALEVADPLFAALTNWISSSGGSDVPINRAIADVIKEVTAFDARPNSPHPWIPNIIPDILVDLPHKQICIEFHFTNRDAPGVIADYVLEKLDVYMDQLTAFLNKKKSS